MANSSFKLELPLERRQADSSCIREKYPGRIPVIVERAEKIDISEINKKFHVVHNMHGEEILNVVFPLLNGTELAKCMLVCKQWRDIARNDFFWKCLCSELWPSVCKRQSPPALSYYGLFKSLYTRYNCNDALPPGISFNDLEFYIDIWVGQKVIFSNIFPGNVLQKEISIPPAGISDELRSHLNRPGYRIFLPMEPSFVASFDCSEGVYLSVLVGRKDSRKVAWIIEKCRAYYTGGKSRALAIKLVDRLPSIPFCVRPRDISVRVSCLMLDPDNKGVGQVFGLEILIDDVKTEDLFLWVLDSLDWK